MAIAKQSLSIWIITFVSILSNTAAMAPNKTTVKRHKLAVSSGRSVAYYTFANDSENETKQAKHPILYLHGYPGSGLEAAVYGCAEHAPDRLVGIDRPGLGYTDSPLAEGKEMEDPFFTCCNDIWELAKHLNWKTFSVVGLSGGSPYALALLASYLSSTDNKPKIEKVALVCGACFSAGTDGMMKPNKQQFDLVQSYESSIVSRFLLHFTWVLVCNLLPLLPKSFVCNIVKSNKELPEGDQKIVEKRAEEISNVLLTSVRQGSRGLIDETKRFFSQHHDCEIILKNYYEKSILSDKKLPEVNIFQGDLDVNVPLSHATYMHEAIFNKQSNLHTFRGKGHFSLIVEEAKTYMAEM